MKPLLAVSFVIVARAAPASPVTTPALLAPGSTYYLALVTAGTRDAASGNIADYDAFVTSQAAQVPELAALLTTWSVIGSTATVSALDHLGPLNAPIYNLAGDLVASSSADLFDGSLAAAISYTQFGDALAQMVYTGTRQNGLACVCLPGNCFCGGPAFGDRTLGSQLVQTGTSTAVDGRWLATSSYPTAITFSFYGVSGPLTVPETEAPIPESGTMILLAGPLALAWWRRRRARTGGPRST